MVSDRKKIFHLLRRKHHRVKGILLDALRILEYIKIIYEFTAKTIFGSLCATYEGNHHVKETKANLIFKSMIYS